MGAQKRLSQIDSDRNPKEEKTETQLVQICFNSTVFNPNHVAFFWHLCFPTVLLLLESIASEILSLDFSVMLDFVCLHFID